MWPQLSLGAAPLLLSLLAPLVSAVPTNPTCSNLNGDFAPFCQPISNVTVFLEATQYSIPTRPAVPLPSMPDAIVSDSR